MATWTVSVQSLHEGMSLTEPMYNESGELLLRARTRITSDLLNELNSRGISVVRIGCSVRQGTAEGARGRFERQLDDFVTRAVVQKKGSAGRASPGTRLSVADLTSEAHCRLAQHKTAGEVVELLSRGCLAGASRLPDGVEQSIREFLQLISVDSDLLSTIVGMQEPQNGFLFDHAVNVALLSMTVGARLGLSHKQLIELGTGALLMNVGMLRVPEAIRLAPRPLTADERIEMMRHAVYTLDALQRLEGIASVAPFVGYQVHERIDGSGYPRGRSGMFIHQYAKIAAVADVYAAMTRPRPYRPAVPPYLAMREILREGSRRRLDRNVIRAVLDCLSLFPIGSRVELTGGVQAQVVRPNPGFHTRPIVVEVNAAGQPTGAIIDLLKESSVQVLRALGPASDTACD